MNRKYTKILMPLFFGLHFSTLLMADIIRVGLDGNPDCDYNNIQEAIDNSLPGDEIRLANHDMVYFENNILVGKHDLSIRGGYSTCSSNVPTENAHTIVHSLSEVTIFKVNTLGANPRPVVDFSNLFLRGGFNAISLDNNNPSAVNVFNSVISGNRYAIQSMGPNGYIGLTDSLIDSNTHGGIVCADPNSYLQISNSVVSNNHATAFDSPLDILDCEVEINDSSITSNSSKYNGGAINMRGGKLVLNSVKFDGNMADSDSDGSGSGGAIHTSQNTEIIARSTCFQNNIAQNGGALALTGGSSYTGVRTGNANGCHKYKANKAFVSGGAIYLEGTGTSALISGAVITDNRADSGVVAVVFDGPNLTIRNSLVTSNGALGEGEFSDQYLFETGGIGIGMNNLEIQYTTISDNEHTGVILKNGFLSNLEVYSSIIYESDGVIYEGDAQASSIFDCLVAHESGSLTNGSEILVSDPLFNDQDNGNYFLSANSPAIDLCSGLGPETNFDYENDSRGIDDPSIINQNGPFDAGFDEFDYRILFRNGFEFCGP